MEDINEKVQNWRVKAANGQLSLDEMREAICFLRGNRTAATEKAREKGTSKKVINSNDLLAELGEL